MMFVSVVSLSLRGVPGGDGVSVLLSTKVSVYWKEVLLMFLFLLGS